VKRVLLSLAVFGLLSVALAQTTAPPQGPPKGPVVGPGQTKNETPQQVGSTDWEHPDNLKRFLKLTDEQFAKVKTNYEKMEAANAALDLKKLGDLAYYKAQNDNRAKFREGLKTILTQEQYKKYKEQLDERSPYELDEVEAAGLAALSRTYREEAQRIQNDPNLTKEQKEKKLQEEQMKLLQGFASLCKGPKKEKMELAVKQYKEMLEKNKESKSDDKSKTGP